MAQQQQQQQHAPTPQLDRAAFKQVVRVPAVRVPKQKCQELMRQLRGFTFDVPKTKCVVHDGDRQDVRLLLLKEGLDPAALAPEVTSILQQHGVSGEVVDHEVHLDYTHLSADTVLKRLLPAGVEVPSSFESVGHIAHFNLRPEVMPFKHIIGQVVLDKNPTLRTVVNKVGQIENEYRVFNMELLAGEHDMATEVSQHGARFRLDFSKVYWNSRLEAEHNRLVSSFEPESVVADVMAGIGPFAVPAGQRGCKVYANDLNPESAKYLATNIHLNRVSAQVTPFNMDGRQFVRLLLATPGGPVEQLPAAQQEDAAAAAAGAGAGAGAGLQQEQGAGQTQQQQQQQQQPAVQQQAAVNQQQQQQQAEAEADSQAKAAVVRKQQQQQQQQQQQKRKLIPEVPPSIPPGFRPPPGGLLFQHAVMNLPASAVEFLDAFNGAFDPAAWQGRELPMVHVYTFQKNETQEDVIKRVEAALGGPLDAPPTIHCVRDVAPKKIMLCVSFRVPRAVAFAGRQQAGSSGAGGEQQQQQQQHNGVAHQQQQQQLEQQPLAKKPKV